MRNDIKETYIQDMMMRTQHDEPAYNEYEKDDEEARKKRIYKEFYRIIEKKIDIKVVHYFEREETEEEHKIRHDEEVQRIEKIKQEEKSAKGKKQDPKIKKKPSNEEIVLDYIKIKECNPSNMSITDRFDKSNIENTPSYIKWISSVYQSIKDLNIPDYSTNKTIWYNIYPQRDGIPVYNPNGIYWVKLFFMGQPVKIEISDYMPCNLDEEYIFPRCDNIEEIWPALFTKALIKLNLYKENYEDYIADEIGDISVYYNLTGYISSNIDSTTITMDIINNYLNDETYLHKKNYILCFNKDKQVIKNSEMKKSHKRERSKEEDDSKVKRALSKNTSFREEFTEPPANFRRSNMNSKTISTKSFSLKNKLIKLGNNIEDFDKKKLMSGKEILNEALINNLRKMTSVLSFKGLNQLFTNNESILPNIVYSIPDFFDSNNFNMKRLKPLDFSDLKQTLKDAQDEYKATFKQLLKEERKAKINEFNELRKKQKQVKAQRIAELKQTGRKFCLIKLKNDINGCPHMNFLVPYTDEEIFMAKKCILNGWDFPPPNFFEKESLSINIGAIDKDNILSPIKTFKQNNIDDDFALDGKKDKGIKKGWNKETYMKALILDNLEQYYNQKDPIVRREEGVWVDMTEIRYLFNTFVLLYNPRNFKYRLSCDNNWHYYKTDLYELKEENKMIKLAKEMSSTNTDVHDLKIKINELVRDIDKCIDLLNE